MFGLNGVLQWNAGIIITILLTSIALGILLLGILLRLRRLHLSALALLTGPRSPRRMKNHSPRD